jgi:hypothetical protein
MWWDHPHTGHSYLVKCAPVVACVILALDSEIRDVGEDGLEVFLGSQFTLEEPSLARFEIDQVILPPFRSGPVLPRYGVCECTDAHVIDDDVISSQVLMS